LFFDSLLNPLSERIVLEGDGENFIFFLFDDFDQPVLGIVRIGPVLLFPVVIDFDFLDQIAVSVVPVLMLADTLPRIL